MKASGAVALLGAVCLVGYLLRWELASLLSVWGAWRLVRRRHRQPASGVVVVERRRGLVEVAGAGVVGFLAGRRR